MQWKCTICNCVYDEKESKKKFGNLPEGWKCPTCGCEKDMYVTVGGPKGDTEIHDIIIIGAGSAGMTCAIYAARYGMTSLVISEDVGGLMNDAYPVENYPGYVSISGFELMQKFKEQMDALKIDMIAEEVKDIKKGSVFEVFTNAGSYKGKTVVIATGSKRRKLGVPGEENFKGKGVHYCAICDAPLYKGKIAAVAGGSDAAAQSALLLAKYAKKVYIIYRKEEIRAEPMHKKKISEAKNIEIINNTNITEVGGDKFVNYVVLDKKHGKSNELKLDAVFVEIGSEPSIGLAKKIGVKINEKNEIVTNDKKETNIEGLFAAGDVTNDYLKQAVVAAADGAKAAFSAYLHLLKKKREGGEKNGKTYKT